MNGEVQVAVVGAGLAGSECAWVLAEHYGCPVTLFDMKPLITTPAQSTPHLFAELVCSNSLKSNSPLNPAGLLKQEMEELGSLVIRAARACAVPAGEALAVDRVLFSEHITQALKGHPRIQVESKVVRSLNDLFIDSRKFKKVIIATGPLTHEELAKDLLKVTGQESLAFYDAIAPIVDVHTIEKDVAFFANRENFSERRLQKDRPGGVTETHGDYLNLPLTREQYLAFVGSLQEAEKVPFHEFEDPRFFNGCQPIEVLAASGPLTLAHGPMKGRGLTDPRTGRWPYAAVQLRKEKQGDSAYNMVGFQTRLTWPAQRQIFRTLPGMQNAEFFRMGTMHRNTYVVSPKILNSDFSLKADPRVTLAGQITGVEGYLESAASGLWMGHVIGQQFKAQSKSRSEPLPNGTPAISPAVWGNTFLPPRHAALGALMQHPLLGDARDYVPMNIHWGLFADPSPDDILAAGIESSSKKLGKSERRLALSKRAERAFREWRSTWHYS